MRCSSTESSSASASARASSLVRTGRRNSRRTPARMPLRFTLTPWSSFPQWRQSQPDAASSAFALTSLEYCREPAHVIDQGRGLVTQVNSPLLRKSIVASSPAVLSDSPFGCDQLAFLEAVQGLEQRRIHDNHLPFGLLLEPADDLVTVPRSPRQRL